MTDEVAVKPGMFDVASRDLADAMPQLVWTALVDGTVDYFNRRWFDYTGLTQGQSYAADGWKDVIHPDDLATCVERWTSAVRTGAGYEIEYRFLRASDQTYRWHLGRALPMRDARGVIVRWYGTATDIDDQKNDQDRIRQLNLELRQKVTDFQVLLETIPVGIAIAHDARCELISVNAHFAKMLGIPHGVNASKTAPPGERPEQFVVRRNGQEVPDHELPMQRAAATGETVMEEVYDIVHAKSGRVVNLLEYAVPLKDEQGNPRGCVGAFVDITQRLNDERALAESRDAAQESRDAAQESRDAAQESRDAARKARDTAQAALESAEQANRAKDQFLATLSHELRTPLTPVLLGLEELTERVAPDLGTDARTTLEMIRRNVLLEARLIDDLLDLTRIARGKFELDLGRVDAHTVLRAAIDICRDDLRTRSLNVTLHLNASDALLRADAARLQQVFWNLVKNAVKFTPPGGSIVVRTFNQHVPTDERAQTTERAQTAGRAQTGMLVIEVQDTGIGIEPHLLKRVFDAFEQGGTDRSRRFGGLGLGLAITRNLVEMHGGRIVALSDGLDRGSTFRVELFNPQADSTPRPVPPDAPDASILPTDATILPTEASMLRTDATMVGTGTSKVRNDASMVGTDASPNEMPLPFILVVDDHLDTSMVMKRLLRRSGYEVAVASSVEQAINTARDLQEQGQVIDLLISDIGLPDGTGMDLMRRLQPIPGIAVSGYGMHDDIMRSRDAGFAAHLTKPLQFDRLLETIQTLIRRPS